MPPVCFPYTGVVISGTTPNGAVSHHDGCRPRRDLWAVLGWAVYLACSWTWCIGMFLPVLLVRDYGLLGYIVFAVPNVVGAAAMGWVIRNRKISRAVVSRHRTACRAFSEVTAAFQLFFLLCFTFPLWKSDITWGDMAPEIGITLGVVLILMPLRFGRTAAWLTWFVSLAVFVVLIIMTDTVRFPAALYSAHNDIGLLFMTPVVVFGFLLCPYLDLTFHRAARRTPTGTTRQTFAVGFGVFFFVMILGTLLYAAATLDGPVHGVLARLPMFAAIPLLIHWTTQLIFTMGAHGRQFRRSTSWRCASPWDLTAAMVLLGVIVLLVIGGSPSNQDPSSHTPLVAGLYAPEVVYRCFMGFYGLVFPAYVWLCMIPTPIRSPLSKPSRRTLTVFAAAVALATPFYWMGFIERRELWLVPGLGIVLIARLFVDRNVLLRDASGSERI